MNDSEKETSAFLASLGVDDDPIPTGTALVIPQVTDVVAEETEDLDQSVNSDFTVARANILAATTVAQEAIAKLAVIAEQSQHPRAFEVLFNGVKTILEAQQDILALHKKREELKPGAAAREDVPTGPQKQTTNNLFVGSTAELQKILADLNK